MNDFTITMPCLFGTEGIAANEVKFKLEKSAECADGRVTFRGDAADIAKANIYISTAERVQLLLGSYEAHSFDELFEGMKALPLEDYVPKDGAFPVKGWSLNSKLTSIPDCQSILKKAAVERLKTRYGENWFAETGAVYQIMFSIMKDKVCIYLDTSGQGLHKRGYRHEGGIAPIKETLAAAIADCARTKAYMDIVDPCCGSGTLLIEAARKALHIAPGVDRRFVCESWGIIPRGTFDAVRQEARSQELTDAELRCYGFDIDPAAVALTLQNAEKARVGKYFTVENRAIRDFQLPDAGKKTAVLANPPYGERLSDIENASLLYSEMGSVFHGENAGFYIISPDEEFEDRFGRKADKRRKLYNGMIKCQLFMYYGC